MQQQPLLILLVGPTASGKTALAVALARALACEVLSFDSRQFYRELPIGAAIPSAEEMQGIPHHFIADRSIHEHLSAGAFEREGNERLATLFARKQVIVAVGGSGLFAKALVEGFDDMSKKNDASRAHWKTIFEAEGIVPLQNAVTERDPVYAAQADMQNHQRLIRALEVMDSTGAPFSTFRKSQPKERPYKTLWIGLDPDRALLHERINQRVLQMVEAGLEDEARRLYPQRALESLQTVGYREWFGYFDGLYDREEAIRLIQRNTRQFARRQMTWFRNQAQVHWFESGELSTILALIQQQLPA